MTGVGEGMYSEGLDWITGILEDTDEHPLWISLWCGRYEFYKSDFAQQKRGNHEIPFEPETRKIGTNAHNTFSPYLPSEYGRAVKRGALAFNGAKVSA
ncbi:MAG: hypothetical protein AAGA86_02400 [Bacteroidota bacterium]